jgi:hypothetical protein
MRPGWEAAPGGMIENGIIDPFSNVFRFSKRSGAGGDA